MSGSRAKCFQGDLNMMSSVSVSFKENLLLRNHWAKSLNSWLITDSIVPCFIAGHKGVVCHLDNVEQLILRRRFVDHLYKEETSKDQMLN